MKLKAQKGFKRIVPRVIITCWSSESRKSTQRNSFSLGGVRSSKTFGPESLVLLDPDVSQLNWRFFFQWGQYDAGGALTVWYRAGKTSHPFFFLLLDVFEFFFSMVFMIQMYVQLDSEKKGWYKMSDCGTK